ncbi:hypothetical protein LWE61_09375 [Sphingobium sufflavum]|uniref:hypothetical protein n=1 Tax=Sphingobium sufflavum TaxID=1129547 RepID=UPI001F44023B|nr:hypothetical protein [Sphingobium sufflavum]MCE7796768.1 hypothetical protein [Sphingobium sufflavum]
MTQEKRDAMPPKGCDYFGKEIVDRMIHHVDKRTDSSLTHHLGISYNTWRKLLNGEPVRISLANRLKARLDLLEQRQRP